VGGGVGDDPFEDIRRAVFGLWGDVQIPTRCVLTSASLHGSVCHDARRAIRRHTELAKEWIAGQRESELIFYVDDHVRVYRGHPKPLPHRYVARERLWPRATTNYWIDAMAGPSRL
jgi:hypothetical protein